MTAAGKTLRNKSFWNRYPRWTKWFAAFLVVELIIILSVVFGYILPKKQKLKNHISDCGYQYAREIENCGSGYNSAVRSCIKDCYTSDFQCISDCYAKNGKYPTECALSKLKYYENCVSTEDFKWPL
jgi:hypothetical protein